ncbi:prepilin-type N-terminal cleavage/methylation domain-containing protein [Modicisalibacter luteus]|uniref:prepilin-type N-terminal cleavage/methylation domain-containing protein n=1 Tax=Modicisalibacter luteus TaxID=453962 RepID=UPI003643324E
MRDLGMSGNTQSGFTLIEALVAILILSLGLLGVAAVQLKAMQELIYRTSVLWLL